MRPEKEMPVTPRTYGDRPVSPNHEFRRAEILDAASDLLRTHGVAACTVRGIAERAGVSKGVIHYYFADAQELVELAFARLAHAYYDHIRTRADAVADPEQRLWHMVVSYVTPWDRHSSMTLLWCEYYVASVRADRLDGVAAMQRAMQDLFAGALARISPEAARHAAALTRHVTGTVLTQPQMPVDPADLVAEVARLLGLAAPATVAVSCPDPDCRFHGPAPGRPVRSP
jgi:AcrR family transcriptional regulator